MTKGNIDLDSLVEREINTLTKSFIDAKSAYFFLISVASTAKEAGLSDVHQIMHTSICARIALRYKESQLKALKLIDEKYAEGFSCNKYPINSYKKVSQYDEGPLHKLDQMEEKILTKNGSLAINSFKTRLDEYLLGIAKRMKA